MRDGKQNLSVSILGLYTLFFVAVLVPYYNWAYRVVVGAAYALFLFVSSFLIVFVLIPYHARRGCFRKAFLVAMLGLLVLFVGSQVHDWRYRFTEKYIKDNYCDVDGPARDEPILGGIKEMKVEGVERTGAFENSSHCLFVVCEEEFFYCDSPVVVMGP